MCLPHQSDTSSYSYLFTPYPLLWLDDIHLCFYWLIRLLIYLSTYLLVSLTHLIAGSYPIGGYLGYEPKDILLAFENTNMPAAEQRLKTLKEARNEASTAHELARQQMAEWSTQGFTPFEKGQKVWLNGRNLKIEYQSRKLAPKSEGPFKITEVMGPVTYCLKLPDQWQIHPVFHASLITPSRDQDQGNCAWLNFLAATFLRRLLISVIQNYYKSKQLLRKSKGSLFIMGM